MKISTKIDVLGLDLDNTLTFRIRGKLPWWCFTPLMPFLMLLPPNRLILNMLREFRESGGEIVIISSRPRFFIKFSELWLRHYKVPYCKIRCVGFIHRSQKKLQVIRKENIKCFIDDDCTVRNFLKKNEPLIKILDPFIMV
ncbi:MAG: hypothetical protein ACKKMW_02690 [Candidatus Nealsonbacteria bacterium]